MKKLFTFILASVLCLLFCACDTQVQQLVFAEPNIEMTVGDSRSVDVTAEPSDAVLSKLTWKSSDSDIVTVDNGVVKALCAGTAVVTVETESGISKSCNITVKDKVITDIILNNSSVSVEKGSVIQLEAKVTPVDAPTSELKWSSDDKDIATVNSEGFVTGIKEGTTNIVCKASNGVESSCTVTVAGGSKKNTTDTNSGTVINNFYGYGHYHPDYTYSATDFVFPESSSRKLTKSEISETLSYMSGYSPADGYAQDAINEIYARNGYVFETQNIREYYESKPWYYADSTFTINDFSSIEKYNIALLEEFN